MARGTGVAVPQVVGRIDVLCVCRGCEAAEERKTRYGQQAYVAFNVWQKKIHCM
jgi:hypothetical protein